MAQSVILRIIMLVFIAKTYAVQYNCQNSKYRALGICVIEYVSVPNKDQVTFPHEPYMQFLRPQIPTVDVEIFNLLPDAKHLEMRDGFVRDVLFCSSVLETLQLMYTDLVTLEALSEPNYSLKVLMVRSPVFSSWSSSLKALKALEKIDISFSNFSYINLEWFVGYENLQVLDLSKNKLHSVYSPPGLKMAALEEFYAVGNKLQFLWRFPDAFPQVKRIALSDNLWLCDWVIKAREAIYLQGMMSMNIDPSCRKGWEMNGGLCCKPKSFEKEKNLSKNERPVNCRVGVAQ